MVVVLGLLALAGCSKQIPPAHMGKILAPTGYQPEVHPPGRVSGFGPFSRNELILLETGTQTAKEVVTVKLKDDAELTFDVMFRTRIAGTDTVLNSMFNDITPVGNKVSLKQVYDTYGKMIVRNQARGVMNDYAVDEVSANFDRISSEMAVAISAAFEGIPLDMSDVTVGKIVWPDEVTEAINATLKSRSEIAMIQADKLKDIAGAEAQLAIANANYNTEMREAQTLRDYNKTISAGISDKFLRLKALKVQELMVQAMIANPNASTVYMPYDAMGTLGAQNKIYGSGK
jgi:hypothetical protein